MITLLDKEKFTCPWLAAKRTIAKIDCAVKVDLSIYGVAENSSLGTEMPPHESTYNGTYAHIIDDETREKMKRNFE